MFAMFMLLFFSDLSYISNAGVAASVGKIWEENHFCSGYDSKFMTNTFERYAPSVHNVSSY